MIQYVKYKHKIHISCEIIIIYKTTRVDTGIQGMYKWHIYTHIKYNCTGGVETVSSTAPGPHPGPL